MKFIFNGAPISKKRHRSAVNNGLIVSYSEQKREEMATKACLKTLIMRETNEKRTEMANAEAFDVVLIFYLPIPKKLNKSQINEIKSGTAIKHANTKPDLDNLIKFYLDVGNGILYKDDKQIVCIQAMKCYDLDPRTEFIITPSRGI